MSSMCTARVCNHNHKFPFKCEAGKQPPRPKRPNGNVNPILQHQPHQLFPAPPVFVTSHPVPSLFPVTSDPAVVWLPRPLVSSKLPHFLWTWVPLVVSLPFGSAPLLASSLQAPFLMIPR